MPPSLVLPPNISVVMIDRLNEISKPHSEALKCAYERIRQSALTKDVQGVLSEYEAGLETLRGVQYFRGSILYCEFLPAGYHVTSKIRRHLDAEWSEIKNSCKEALKQIAAESWNDALKIRKNNFADCHKLPTILDTIDHAIRAYNALAGKEELTRGNFCKGASHGRVAGMRAALKM